MKNRYFVVKYLQLDILLVIVTGYNILCFLYVVLPNYMQFSCLEIRRKDEDSEEAAKRRKQRAKKRKQQMEKQIEEDKVEYIHCKD